jgi:hypothetical protein
MAARKSIGPPRLGERNTTDQEQAGYWVRLSISHFHEMQLHPDYSRGDRPCATEWVRYAIGVGARLHKGPPAKGELAMSEQVAALAEAVGHVQAEAVEHDDQVLLAATNKASDDLAIAADWLS